MSEAKRLDALHGLEILDTASEETFDRLLRTAAEVLEAPVALVTLVDEARLWFKASIGVTNTETPRDRSFCTETIKGDDLLVVEDASRDPRFATSPLVTEKGFRFYAGAPVALAGGDVVGAVCVLDTVARESPDPASAALLQGLAAAVGHLLDLRREIIARREAEARLAEHARLLELAEEMAEIGTWRLDIGSGALHLSPAIFKIYGLDASGPTPAVDTLLDMYDPGDRARIVYSLERARTQGRGYAFDARLHRGGDEPVRDVRVMARVETDAAGKPATLIGALRDITVEKKALEVLYSQRVEADRRAQRMRQLASVDVLTGLPNRRAFLEKVEETLGGGANVSLAVLDIDHFKAINDRLGHAGGDEALAAFGRICARFSASALCLGRIGGEEFAALVEDETGEEALRLIDRLREAIAAERLRTREGEARLTFSAGLARRRPGDDWSSLFARADQALYEAKNGGRDRSALAA